MKRGNMTYNNILTEKLNPPTGTFEKLIADVKTAIDQFETDNLVLNAVRDGVFTMENYHSLLKNLFYQVWVGPGTFALAGGLMPEKLSLGRDYLLHHAEEEKLHWTWIISDLRATGYQGKDPRELYPSVETQAYLSYATFLAFRFPLGRLAMASVLEGISAKYGELYGKKLATVLKLKPEQLQFFLTHGVLDQDHSQDIFNVLKATEITPQELGQMSHVAHCTGVLYKQMYNGAMKSR
jgi:hypothetical protein